MRTALTPQAEKRIEEEFELKREAMELLDVIAAEFKSDPQSVKCFHSRVVERAIYVAERYNKIKLF